MAKVTAVPTVSPDIGLPQTPTQSKNSDNVSKQTMFHTAAARALSSKSAVSVSGRMLLRWRVVFRVVMRKRTDYRTLYAR